MATRRKRAKRRKTLDDEIETTNRTLAEELEADPFEGIPPEASDLLSPPADRLARLEAKGVDTVADKVRILKRINGKWVRKSGTYPPTLNVAQLERLFGAGVYGFEVINASGHYLWRNTATIGDVDEMAELEAIAGVGRQRESAGAGPGVVNVGASSELGAVLGAINQMSRTMERMMDRMSMGAGAPQDPLRDSIAGMAKMMQLSMMAQTQAQTFGQSQAKGSDEAVVHLLGELIKRPQPTPIQADLELLRLGLGLGAQLAGRPSSEGEDPNKLPAWAQILPDVVDSIGVPTIMTLAQALLPADKARAVADVIRAHAEGGAGGEDDDGGENERSNVRAKQPIDVPGHAA